MQLKIKSVYYYTNRLILNINKPKQYVYFPITQKYHNTNNIFLHAIKIPLDTMWNKRQAREQRVKKKKISNILVNINILL